MKRIGWDEETVTWWEEGGGDLWDEFGTNAQDSLDLTNEQYAELIRRGAEIPGWDEDPIILYEETEAELFAEYFDAVERTEDGWMTIYPDKLLKSPMWSEHKTVSEPRTGGAIDPSWDVTFSDGSAVHIGNPNQEVYPAWIIVKRVP